VCDSNDVVVRPARWCRYTMIPWPLGGEVGIVPRDSVGFFHTLRMLLFMDRYCIEQEDHALKLSEIRLIPQIINKSNNMLILLNDNYFTRLWRCYEMAVFTTFSEGSPPHFKRTTDAKISRLQDSCLLGDPSIFLPYSDGRD